MTEQQLFATFWEKESDTTRRVISRIPEGATYKPDPKSRTAAQIAWQIVCEERTIIEGLESGTLGWAASSAPATIAELLEVYDAQRADVIARWKKLPAERWTGIVDVFGKERSSSAMAWSFFFDIIHHRGQLTTYLRPMGSTVPQVYGPTADEP